MVNVEIINQVFNEILNNNSNKCWTKDQIREKLSGLNYNEKFEQLKNENLLNPLEREDYEHLLKAYNNHKETLDNPKMVESYQRTNMYDGLVEDFEYIQKTLFEYDRRLIEGLKYNDVPDINVNDFTQDTQYKRINDLLDKHGELEQKQIEAQNQEFNKQNTTDSERHSMDWYFAGDLNNLNKTIYGFTSMYGKHYDKKLDNEQKRNVKDIDNLMKRTPALQQATTFYRVGHWDIHLKPGDHAKWKGYTSTTFQEKVIDAYKEDHRDAMKMVILAPKGTKGIVGDNRPVFTNDIGEHEYTLPRNSGYTVVDIDYDTMTAIVVLD